MRPTNRQQNNKTHEIIEPLVVLKHLAKFKEGDRVVILNLTFKPVQYGNIVSISKRRSNIANEQGINVEQISYWYFVETTRETLCLKEDYLKLPKAEIEKRKGGK